MKQRYTAEEVAKLAQCSRSSVLKAYRSGCLYGSPAYGRQRPVYFSEYSVNRWLDGLEPDPEGEAAHELCKS